MDKNTLTEGVIWKKLLFFAMPIFLGNLFQQMYNTCDSLIVGRCMNETALAAVASSGSLIFMMVSFFSGIAMGAGVVISNYYGAGDKKNLHLAIHTDLAFGLVSSVVLTVVGMTFTPVILRWMGTPENVLPYSVAYFRTYFAGTIFSMIYNTSVGILQAVGDSKHPLYYLIISSITNVLLDLLFIAVFHWGVWAAALATILSQMLSAVFCIYRLTHYDTVYQVKWREIGFHIPNLKKIVRIGVPSGVQNSIIAVANLVVQSNINRFGDLAMAGCGSYFKLEGFAFLPITCFSMGISTFVGQNLGARKYERVHEGVRFGVICSMLMAELVGVVLFTFSPQLVALFNPKPEVVAFGVKQARVEALFYCLLAFSHCISAVMRGSGNASVPMFTMLATWCLTRITYITLMIRVIPRIEVVFSAYPLTWSLSSIILVTYFFRKDWIHTFERQQEKERYQEQPE